MLHHLLHVIRRYEHVHGVPPTVVYLNPGHYAALRTQCPGLFVRDPAVRLGLRLVILPAAVLRHPQAARPAARGASRAAAALSPPPRAAARADR